MGVSVKFVLSNGSVVIAKSALRASKALRAASSVLSIMLRIIFGYNLRKSKKNSAVKYFTSKLQ